jgi:sec-independent protein translocase protein TatC
MSTVAGELRGFGIGTANTGSGRPLSNALWKTLTVIGVLLSDMSFLEHLEELRRRLIKSVIAIAVGVFVCTAYTPAIVRFLKAPAAKYGVELVGYGGWEMFSLYFDVAFAAGVSLAAPFVLFQIWRFIEPALYPHERRYALPFLVSTTLFFIIGAAFGYFVATPYIVELSRDLAALMEVTWRPGALEYVSLLTATVVAMGVVFEMPPIVFILSRIGLVDAPFLIRNFKYAFLTLAILSGVLTPSGDLGPMIAFLAVMTALYFLSVLVALIFARKRTEQQG